jgi:hypothetical protein
MRPGREVTMKAWDYEAVVYDGAIYCVQCLPPGVDADSDDVSPIFASDEVTAPGVVCEACGALHDYMGLVGPDIRAIAGDIQNYLSWAEVGLSAAEFNEDATRLFKAIFGRAPEPGEDPADMVMDSLDVLTVEQAERVEPVIRDLW